MVFLVPIMLIAILLYKIDIVSSFFAALDTMLMVVGVCSLSILFDMKKGNQHWETSAELRMASKGNLYQIVTVFISIVPAVVLFALGMVLAGFAETLGEITVKAIFWSVGTILSAIVCIAGVCVLKSKGVKWYAVIGENNPDLNAARKTRNIKNKGLLK